MMRLAISNIAWRPHEAAAIYPVISALGVTGLEIAPGIAFAGSADPLEPSGAELSHFQDEIASHSLTLVSMQSLLFNNPDARVFGDANQQTTFEHALTRAVQLAGRLGIPNLVFGSPAARRVPPDMTQQDAQALACGVFRRLGDKAQSAGATIAIEPNPAGYNCNFLTTLEETLAFVQAVDHPAITVNFDIGAMHMNGSFDRAAELFAIAQPRVSHVHISEPGLAPAPADEQAFGKLATALLARGYDQWLSIEMRQSGEDSLDAVRAAVAACARQIKAAS